MPLQAVGVPPQPFVPEVQPALVQSAASTYVLQAEGVPEHLLLLAL